VLQPLLGSPERFDAYVRRAEGGALGARLRLSTMLRAVAMAARRVGALDALLPGGHIDALHAVMRKLARDRDPGVALGAAWALGVLAPISEGAREAIAELSAARAGMLARRAFVARAARWLDGDEDDDKFLEELQNGLGRSDPNARAAVVASFRFALRTAPDTAVDIVQRMVKGGSSEILIAAARFAEGVADTARREALVEAIRSASSSMTPTPALAYALGPRSKTAERIHSGIAAVRQAVLVAPASARGASSELLQVVQSAVKILGSDGAPHDIDLAIDAALLDSPLLRDATAASASSTTELAQQQKRWREAVSALVDTRARRELAAQDDVGGSRASIRGLGRAIDALPRPRQRDHDRDEFELRVRRAATSLLEIAVRRNESAYDLPLAAAVGSCVDALVAADRLAAVSVATAMLGLSGSGLLRNLGTVLVQPELANVARTLAELRSMVEQSRRKHKPRTTPAHDIVKSIDMFVAALERIDTASTTTQGSRMLAATATNIINAAHGASDLPIPVLAARAVSYLNQAAQETAALFEIAQPRSTKAIDAEVVMRALLCAVGLHERRDDERLPKPKRARREMDALMPPALRGVFTLLFADVPNVVAQTRSQPSPPEPTWIGRKLGDYVVLDVLGEGGMGRCLLVRRRLERDENTARRWVLKIPKEGDNVVRAFREEAKALLHLAELDHPAIVRFLSIVDPPGKRPFLVMQFVQGRTLEQRLSTAWKKTKGGLPLEASLHVARWLCDAVAAAHSTGVSHFDIKPANVIVPEGTVAVPVLVDWGLAGSGAVFAGTAGYMAPERFALPATAVKAGPSYEASPADVFALGCVLCESITGHPLFGPPVTQDDGDRELLEMVEQMSNDFREPVEAQEILTRKHIRERRLGQSLTRLPQSVADLVERMVADDPQARPRATQVAAQLLAQVSKR
jgi:Protein kinase domain